jgi:hypothetical protein
MEERHPLDLQRAQVQAEDNDGSTGGDQLAASGQALLGAGRLDDDVVQTVRGGASAEALACFVLVRMPPHQRNVLALQLSCSGNG